MPFKERFSKLKIAEESKRDTKNSPPGHSGTHKTVFIDRDGVINQDTQHTWRKDELKLFEGVPEAFIKFRELGLKIIIATNQGGMAMGRYGKEEFASFMEELKERLLVEDPWDMVYFSPFHNTAEVMEFRIDHIDRKPGPGMLLRAALEHDIDLPSSYMVGDHLKDVSAAHRAGCMAVLVLTGRGKGQLQRIIDEDLGPGDERYPEHIVEDLRKASDLIEHMEGQR
jgi:D-glycero-D-manno-heptose 1,7-bisphosphate phosphatase